MAGGATTGIQFQVDSDSGVTLEVQRDTNNAFPAPVAVVSIKNASGSETVTDSLPLNNTNYYYRARASKTGYQTTAWSATLGPYKPVVLDTSL